MQLNGIQRLEILSSRMSYAKLIVVFDAEKTFDAFEALVCREMWLHDMRQLDPKGWSVLLFMG